MQALTSKKAQLYLLKSSDISKENEATVFSMDTSSNELADGNKMSDVTNTIKNFEIFQKPQIINTVIICSFLNNFYLREFVYLFLI